MRRTASVLALLTAFAMAFAAIVGLGCNSSYSAALGPSVTVEMDGPSEIIEAATPVNWGQLMAGAPTDRVLKVSGTIGPQAIGADGFGIICVDGNSDHLLVFKLAKEFEEAGLVSTDQFHEGEAVLYGTVSGEAGIETHGGPDMVRLFYVGLVEYVESAGTQ